MNFTSDSQSFKNSTTHINDFSFRDTAILSQEYSYNGNKEQRYKGHAFLCKYSVITAPQTITHKSKYFLTKNEK
jgi:hypothetical protein